jgi:hypothetical protein
MDAFLARPWAALPLSEDLEKFSPGTLAGAVKKNGRPPAHPFFERFGDFRNVAGAVSGEMEAHVRFLRSELFRYVRQELAVRKRRRNLRSYDDLLSISAARSRRRAPASSPDDPEKYRPRWSTNSRTDPVQYAIIESLFGQGETALFPSATRSRDLQLPGADLFAYIRAASSVQRRYTLAENCRSEPC